MLDVLQYTVLLVLSACFPGNGQVHHVSLLIAAIVYYTTSCCINAVIFCSCCFSVPVAFSLPVSILFCVNSIPFPSHACCLSLSLSESLCGTCYSSRCCVAEDSVCDDQHSLGWLMRRIQPGQRVGPDVFVRQACSPLSLSAARVPGEASQTA